MFLLKKRRAQENARPKFVEEGAEAKPPHRNAEALRKVECTGAKRLARIR